MRIILDSGVFNADLLMADYGEQMTQLFAKSPLRDRLDLLIAHEYEEHRNGMSHVKALEAVPVTKLRISDRVRGLGSAMREGWKGR